MLSHRKTFQFLIILLLFVAGTASLSQTLESGPQVLTFFSDVDDKGAVNFTTVHNEPNEFEH